MARSTPLRIDSDSPAARWVPIALVAVTIASFASACASEFVTWDDQLHVYQNPLLHPATLGSLGAFWTHPYEGLYIPLTYTMWWGIAQIAQVPAAHGAGTEFNPWIFHAANVLLQCISVVLLYRLLRALVGKEFPAGAGAVLWAVHPLQVESVAWVSAGKDQLCGVLAIASLLLLLTPKTSAVPAPGTRRDGLATLLFIAALLAKPAAVVIPVMAAVLVYSFPQRPGRYRWLAAWVGLAIIDVLITKHAQPVAIPEDGGRWWLRPLLAADALEFYLLKLFVPIGLAMQYDRSAAVVIDKGWQNLNWVAPILFLAIGWVLRRRMPYVWVGLLIFIVGLLPVLGLVPFKYQDRSGVADHYAHLALIGPALGLAWGLCLVPVGRINLASVVFGAVILLLCGLSIAQTMTWKDSITLYRYTLAVNPRSWVASENLGDIYEGDGDGYEALPYFQTALIYRPPGIERAELYVDYANALAMTNQFPASDAAYRTAERLNFHAAGLRNNWSNMRRLWQKWQLAHTPTTRS